MPRVAKFKPWCLFDYYQWLLERIDGYKYPYYDYSLLLHELHSIEFKWVDARDSNRADDGIKLRWIYMDEQNIADIFYKEGIPCSVLEMLIGMSYRCHTQIDDRMSVAELFWIMIENLDLMRCTDDNFNGDYVRQQIRNWLDRVFRWNGSGSPFPLRKARYDQRKVEIWFQMCGYLNENFP